MGVEVEMVSLFFRPPLWSHSFFSVSIARNFLYHLPFPGTWFPTETHLSLCPFLRNAPGNFSRYRGLVALFLVLSHLGCCGALRDLLGFCPGWLCFVLALFYSLFICNNSSSLPRKCGQ
jgi:hypothetical protein